MRLFELDRKVSNEAHYFKEFIRFASYENRVLVSHIEPKSNVLSLVSPYFSDRLPSENWMIIDDGRRFAMVHPADQECYLTSLSPDEMRELSQKPDDAFVDLWKGFLLTSASGSDIIPAAREPCCRSGTENMTEFQ